MSKYLVEGTKKSGKQASKQFHCYEDAAQFAEDSGWEGCTVSKVENVAEAEPDEDALTRRARKAAARYIEMRGCEIVDRDYWTPDGTVDLVFLDCDTLVFADVHVSTNVSSGFLSVREHDRERFERMALHYIAGDESGSTCDRPMRFDELSMCVVSGDRAAIRHHVNVFGEVR